MPDAAASPHPFDTPGGQHAPRSVRVLIADAALRNVGKGGDAGVWMEPEPSKLVSVSLESVKEYEGLQETAKIRRRHQACDGSVILSTGASGDAGRRIFLHDGCGHGSTSGFVVGFQVRHGLSFLQLHGLERSIESRSCMFPFFFSIFQ